MYFRLSTIEPGSLRHTYLADDLMLLDCLKDRYKEDEYVQVKEYVRNTKGKKRLEFPDRMGRRTILERMEYGW